MLTIEDCIALSELNEEEVALIGRHEHLPTIVAAELGNYLVRTQQGEVMIRRIIADELEKARRSGDLERTAALRLVLRHYLDEHGHAASQVGPQDMKGRMTRDGH